MAKVPFWQVEPQIHVYRLQSDDAAEDDETDDGVPSFVEWELPNRCASKHACVQDSGTAFCVITATAHGLHMV